MRRRSEKGVYGEEQLDRPKRAAAVGWRRKVKPAQSNRFRVDRIKYTKEGLDCEKGR
jgi:hypothetical protein